MAGALDGILVLDLSRILAGPWATQMLADLGADVVKIERPGRGDDTRRWGPPWWSEGSGGDAVAAYYLAANRGKQSVTVDLSTPEGADIVRRLAAQSDVLVENFRPGGLARLGLSWDSLSEANPKLIYCAISAFGQDGPLRDAPGYDAMIQAMGGFMSLTGPADGEPQKAGVAIADLMAGMYAVSAILAALHERERSGLGQYIDIGLLDTQVAWLANQAMNYLVSGDSPGRMGTAHPNIAPYQAFETADGFFMLAVGNDEQFAALCDLLERPDLAADARFAANAARVAHRDALTTLLGGIFRQQPVSHWLDALRRARVPCGPINDLAAVFDEPQVKARGLARGFERPDGRALPQVANPVRFSRSALAWDRPPPSLGEDTEAVLARRLGLDAATIARLRRDGVL